MEVTPLAWPRASCASLLDGLSPRSQRKAMLQDCGDQHQGHVEGLRWTEAAGAPGTPGRQLQPQAPAPAGDLRLAGCPLAPFQHCSGAEGKEQSKPKEETQRSVGESHRPGFKEASGDAAMVVNVRSWRTGPDGSLQNLPAQILLPSFPALLLGSPSGRETPPAPAGPRLLVRCPSRLPGPTTVRWRPPSGFRPYLGHLSAGWSHQVTTHRASVSSSVKWKGRGALLRLGVRVERGQHARGAAGRCPQHLGRGELCGPSSPALV